MAIVPEGRPVSPQPPAAAELRSTSADQAALRDALALDRTVMANERTLLSYVRTALALGAAGFTLIAIFESPWLRAGGWAAAALGMLTMLIGVRRSRAMHQRLRDMTRRSTG